MIARTLGDPGQGGVPQSEGTMNRFRRFVIPALGAMVALLVTSTVAIAAGEDTDLANSGAFAEIIAPIAIAHDVDMNFGSIVPSAGGTVALPASATPTRVATGPTLGDPDDVAAAKFTVTGEPDKTYSITLPGNADVELDGPALSDPMTVTNFISSPTVAAGGLLTAGTQTLYVGATLNVAADQDPGIYEGDFDVTVTYN